MHFLHLIHGPSSKGGGMLYCKVQSAGEPLSIMRGCETADMTGLWCGMLYCDTESIWTSTAREKSSSYRDTLPCLHPHRSHSVPARSGERKIISPNTGLDKESRADGDGFKCALSATGRLRGDMEEARG